MTQPMPHRFPGLTFAAIAAELAREAQARIKVHTRELERGRITRADLAREAALIAAWQHDCRRMAALQPGQNPNSAEFNSAHPELVEGHGLTWRARTNGLERELRLRGQVYPKEIEQGRLTAAQAAHQLRCLEALRTIYHDGLDWPANPEQRAALYAEIQGQRHPTTQQQELAL